MTDRPIIFSAPMVRALLDGRKTQTRRVLPASHPKFPQHNQIRMDVLAYNPQRPEAWYWDGVHDRVGASFPISYAPGDRLYVREAHALWADDESRIAAQAIEGTDDPCIYRADYIADANCENMGGDRWRPSIHMPRWASRLTLTVTDVRVQRLADLTDEDAQAEGMAPLMNPEPVEAFRALWNSLHGPGAWDANPWVVAVSFTVQHGNIYKIGGDA